MATPPLVPNFATRWCLLHWLQIWPSVGTIFDLCNFIHQVARWHHLYWLQIWPPGGATCIGWKFGYRVALVALVASLATRQCHIATLPKISILPNTALLPPSLGIELVIGIFISQSRINQWHDNVKSSCWS